MSKEKRIMKSVANVTKQALNCCPMCLGNRMHELTKAIDGKCNIRLSHSSILQGTNHISVLLMWTKLPLSSWKNLIIYGSGMFVIWWSSRYRNWAIQEAILGENGPTIQTHRFAMTSVAFRPNSTVSAIINVIFNIFVTFCIFDDFSFSFGNLF